MREIGIYLLKFCFPYEYYVFMKHDLITLTKKKKRIPPYLKFTFS